VYDSADVSIVAVSPAMYAAWPCGTSLEICGAAGCIETIRQDACPGCGAYQVDLSEAGIAAACGEGVGSCSVTIRERGRVE
jgi:hypothetical protein